MSFNEQKMQFSIRTFFSFLRIWSHLLKKSLMENFIFVQYFLLFDNVFFIIMNVAIYGKYIMVKVLTDPGRKHDLKINANIFQNICTHRSSYRETYGGCFQKKSTLVCNFYFLFICINKDIFWVDHQLNSPVIIVSKKKKTK